MKLYQTPGGAWSKSEAQWAKDMKAEGRDPKKHTGRKSVDVPVKADALMEFLTFHNVNVIEPAGGAEHAPAPASSAVPLNDAPAGSIDETFAALPTRRKVEIMVATLDEFEKKLA